MRAVDVGLGFAALACPVRRNSGGGIQGLIGFRRPEPALGAFKDSF